MTLVWYVSGHGFGHASRDIEVLNAIRAIRPDVRIVVRTSANRWIFDLTLKSAVDFQPAECDTGVVQIDSLRLDEAETVRRAAAFYASFGERVRAEADVLRAVGASLVVSDLPPLGLAAAKAAGVPALALGNFTWDWIYDGYEPARYGATTLVETVRAATALADAYLRLPMWGGFGMAPANRIVDLPLVARRSSRRREDTRRALGLPEDKRLVLLSFGGHGVRALAPETFASFGDDYVGVVSGHLEVSEAARASGRQVVELDESGLYASGWRYEDLVGAVDVVATKPGYGIIAECAAHQTAMLYTSRGHFVEYDVLVREMPRYVRAEFISQDEFFAGNWRPYLDALLARPQPTPARVDGAEVAAHLILERL
jgi:hypothetical protein